MSVFCAINRINIEILFLNLLSLFAFATVNILNNVIMRYTSSSLRT